MSSMVRCNFCEYNRLKVQARLANAKISLFVEASMIAVKRSDKEQPSMWVPLLTDSCVC